MSEVIKSFRQARNIICVPFAFKEDANTGINIRCNAYDVYLKNACVALCSAKYHNPNTDVCLATNLKEDELPEIYINILHQAGVSINHIPFDCFVFPDKYMWSLAFYKLCVLKHLSGQAYNNICYLDTDVYIQGAFDNIWEECEQNILLYDINHGLGVSDYRIISDEFEKFLGQKKYVTHYGGEFFAAPIDKAQIFCAKAESIYKKMIDKSFQTSKGDEFIVSLAADQMRESVKNAGAYVFRFWTGSFRLVSTCYKYNRVTVLHMPAEKNRGILKLYNKYIKKGAIPPDITVWKICRLKSVLAADKSKKLITKILPKINS